jgi:diguanylate cyclase (GGDEF)-like protein
MLIDLDRFKNINESLGTPTGERIIVQSAQRLSSTVRAGDTIPPMGGDAFVVIRPGVVTADAVVILAQQLLAAMSCPMVIQDHGFYRPEISAPTCFSRPDMMVQS